MTKLLNATQSNSDSPQSSKGADVWVLEDNPTESAAIVSALMESGLQVSLFETLAGFVDSLEAAKAMPACVIADIHLGDGSFFDIIDDYVKIELPTIILSQIISPLHVKVLAGSPSSHITLLEKPVSYAVLAARVVSIIEKSQSEMDRHSILEVDSSNGIARNSVGSIEITPLEGRILRALESTEQFTVSLLDLMRKTWPDERKLSKAKMRVNVSRLNAKIAIMGIKIIYIRSLSVYTLVSSSTEDLEQDSLAEAS